MTDLQAKKLTQARLIQYRAMKWRGRILNLWRIIDGRVERWTCPGCAWINVLQPAESFTDDLKLSPEEALIYQREKALKLKFHVDRWLRENP